MASQTVTISRDLLDQLLAALSDACNVTTTLDELCDLNLEAESPMSIQAMACAVKACVSTQDRPISDALGAVRGALDAAARLTA